MNQLRRKMIMNHSRNLDAVLRGGLEHQSFQSPYEQFQQEYPKLDEYGQKVTEGGYLKENLDKFDTALSGARGQMFDGGQPANDSLMDYFGFGAMTKAKLTSTEDLLKQIESGDIPEIFKRQSGASVDPNFVSKPPAKQGITMQDMFMSDMARRRNVGK